MTSREPPAAGEPPRVGALGVEKSAAVPVDVRAEVDVLLASSAWALDEHEHERYAAFFTEDATYEVEGAVLHGRGEIERRFTERRGERTTRHLCGGVRIVPEDDGSWKVESVWLSFAANARPPIEQALAYQVADFHDEVVERDGRWLIRRRRIESIFRDPALAPRP